MRMMMTKTAGWITENRVNEMQIEKQINTNTYPDTPQQWQRHVRADQDYGTYTCIHTGKNTCVYTNNNARTALRFHSSRLHFEKFLWTISLLWEVQQGDHVSHFFPVVVRPFSVRMEFPAHHNIQRTETETHIHKYITEIRISQNKKKSWICLNSNDDRNRKASLTHSERETTAAEFDCIFIVLGECARDLCMCCAV